jgi:hypothetical protein
MPLEERRRPGRPKDRKISINDTEADRVRTIFRSCLRLGSLNRLMADLRDHGIVTKTVP